MKPANRNPRAQAFGRGGRRGALIRAAGALVRALALAGAAAALGGCLESADTIHFQPGVYQGAPDPLIGNSDAAALESRFKGQTDR